MSEMNLAQGSPPYGDSLLTAVVDEQLAVYKTPMRSKLFFLSSGANELEPPPLYRSFLRREYDKSGLLQCYTNGTGYPPLVKMTAAYESFGAGKRVSAELRKSHSAVVTFGAAGAISGAMNCIAKQQLLKVLLIDYTYPIFERVVKLTGGQIYQVLPKDPTKPVLMEDAIRAIFHIQPNIVILCNTSNPTGQSYDQSFLDGVFKASKQVGTWVIYDRVCDFDIGQDAECNCLPIGLTSGIVDRLVIVNSISKTCALPGLRIGWAFCPKAMAEDIGELQFRLCENPLMAGVTPLILDLWLRMENVAENSEGSLDLPDRQDLSQLYDFDGLIRPRQSREFFEKTFLSQEMDNIYRIHVNHFEKQVNIFHHNFGVFKSLLGPKLENCPTKMKGYNVMFSRKDFRSTDPVRITSELIHDVGLSTVPEACFISSQELAQTDRSHFRLSLATKPAQFKGACKRFANWSPTSVGV
ncbi:MAG TPA: pyridoxal phosphate-dependent aminotransferase [Candidatus Bathyarchaeia archaeon]|nr:pyridoxal phosphate-dependent aminotransferase [Candidatus Bathyarchaeia archaeon]